MHTPKIGQNADFFKVDSKAENNDTYLVHPGQKKKHPPEFMTIRLKSKTLRVCFSWTMCD